MPKEPYRLQEMGIAGSFDKFTGFSAWRDAMVNFGDFSGQSSRSTYWLAMLFNTVFVRAPLATIAFLFLSAGLPWIAMPVIGLYELITLLPFLALITRRLHHAGLSGWFAVGYIALMIYLVIWPTGRPFFFTLTIGDIIMDIILGKTLGATAIFLMIVVVGVFVGVGLWPPRKATMPRVRIN